MIDKENANYPDRQVPDYRNYVVFAAIAFVAGAFFRFWDLHGAPLAVDEYFFGTSILNIVERGLPEFACGGFYTRGVLIQYLSVPLVHLGASLEFATRFWPAVASLLSIVAVWKIGRLAGGLKTAAIAVTLVSLSVWEIEFARFGRMYAPFQAVFLWYVYLQLLHLIRGSNKARWSYLALSAVSIFVYAGASFLLAFNFLALVWAGKRWSVSHLVVATVLLIFGVGFFALDHRHLGVPPEAAQPVTETEAASSLPINIPVLPDSTLPILLFGLIATVYLVFRYRSDIRALHPSIIYWAVAALAMCFGLFSLAAGLGLAGLLLRLPTPLSPAVREKSTPVLLLIVLCCGWIALLLALYVMNDVTLLASIKGVLNYTFNFPDLYHYVLRPWLQAIPVTAVIMTLLAGLQVWASLAPHHRGCDDEHSVQRYVAGALILLVMLAALFKQPYTITRYTYFLYPLVLVLASITVVHWSSALFKNPRLRLVGTIVPIALLSGVAEDFRIGHLLRINEPEIRYRTAYNNELGAHYYPRWDFRAAAFFVNERLSASDNVIVFDQPLPHYLDRTSGIYIRSETKKYSMIEGCSGTRDLWSNAPLLGTENEVRKLISQTEGDVWLIMRTDAYTGRDPLESSLPKEYRLEPSFVTHDRNLVVYRLQL